MGLLRTIGNLVQKTLFTTTFEDVMASLEDLQRRIGQLENKIDEKTRELEQRLAEVRAHSTDEESKAS